MQFVFLNVSYGFFSFCLICQIHIFGPATIFHYQMQFLKSLKVSLGFKAFCVNFQIIFRPNNVFSLLYEFKKFIIVSLGFKVFSFCVICQIHL
jgi:hypothetical protein